MSSPFLITPKSPSRVDLELNGRIDAEAMKSALDDLISLSADIEHGKMLYRINEFRIPTFGALAIEFSRLPGLFSLMMKYERVAVIADKEWLRKVGEWEGKLFPTMEIKAFTPEEADAAEAWLMSGGEA